MHRARTLDLVLLDLERGKSRCVTTDDAWESEPFWSPDARRIGCAGDPDGPPDIYLLDLATGATERL